MTFLDKVHLEWWQALAVLLAIGVLPFFKAAAVVLVARLVRPDIAKLALPLIFHRRPFLRVIGTKMENDAETGPTIAKP